MKHLHIIMPMAGKGSRFVDAGVTTPKPLIEVDGMPMFAKALSSFDSLDVPKKYTFIVRQDHIDDFKIDKHINKILPEANIVALDQITRGAVETVMKAEKYLVADEPLILMDCDLYIQSPEFTDKLRAICKEEADPPGGMLVYFKADNPRYSYVKLVNGVVTETAEKKVISSHAIAGAYCFGQSGLFKEIAKELLERPISPEMKEYYISYLYNSILMKKLPVLAFPTTIYHSFGTPEELRQNQDSM